MRSSNLFTAVVHQGNKNWAQCSHFCERRWNCRCWSCLLHSWTGKYSFHQGNKEEHQGQVPGLDMGLLREWIYQGGIPGSSSKAPTTFRWDLSGCGPLSGIIQCSNDPHPWHLTTRRVQDIPPYRWYLNHRAHHCLKFRSAVEGQTEPEIFGYPLIKGTKMNWLWTVCKPLLVALLNQGANTCSVKKIVKILPRASYT